jgi:hypothetical protein
MSFVVAFAAAGCSGKDKGPGAPENPSASAPRVNQPASGDKAIPITGDIPAAVDRVLTLAHETDDATFTATYRVRLADGKRATTRLAQQPPKFGFHILQRTQRSVVISDGKVMHGCESSGKGWRCAESSVDDATEIANTYPGAVLHLIDGLIKGIGREIKVGTARRTVMGAKVDCATFRSTIENPPPPQIYCVRKDGVLAYASTLDGQILELTGFKSSVDAADLAIPRQ